MALQRSVIANFEEPNQATGPANRNSNESGFPERANELDPFAAP